MDRKQKNRRARNRRAAAVIGVLFCTALFLAGCQPTPDAPPVVNKAEGMTNAMFAEPLPDGQKREVDAPAHWTDSILRQDGRIEIKADVDVEIPNDLGNTPVFRLAQIPLSQERLETLVSYFAGNNKLYKPLPMAKTELRAQLTKMQKREGDYGSSHNKSRVPDMQTATEKLMDEAPETVEKESMEIGFSLPVQTEYDRAILAQYDPINQPQVEKFMNACLETGEPYEPRIKAQSYDPDVGTVSSFGYWYPGIYVTESDIREQETEFAFYDSGGVALSDVGEAWLAAEKQQTAAVEELIDGITTAQEQAEQVAQKALNDLGIVDVRLSDTEKGAYLLRPYPEWDKLAADLSQAETGYCMTYTRSADALAGYPRFSYTVHSALKNDEAYAQPFLMETVQVFVSNGKILSFRWENLAEQTEQVAKNTNLLPFEEIKNRFANDLALAYAIPEGDGGAPDEYKERGDIQRVQLRADYIPAKDAPNEVWIVPVWVFSVQRTALSAPREETILGTADFTINALDGGTVLPYSPPSS